MNKANIRNFCIIAHIDHGKSTLADRLLELTGTVQKDKIGEQYLDRSAISKERGITIKLAPVRMLYKITNPKSQILNNHQILDSNTQNDLENRNLKLEIPDLEYALNLIDTPGHVDFSYEVSRTLAACEGAVLLVDATQGIQAQTVAHYYSALREKLKMIPVVNKIDLENAQIETTTQALIETFGFKKEEIIYISAKTGENVPFLLETIVKRMPAPCGLEEKPLKALIFDAIYDEYKGVIAYVKIVDGKIKTRDRIRLFQNNVETEISEVGFFTPFLKPCESLGAGEIGYVATGIKDIKKCRVGDTITMSNVKYPMSNVEALPGYKQPKPMVFFGIYPKSTDDFVRLRESLVKLTLNDTSLTYSEEYSAYLGSGYRVGFLGLLHAEIIKERLKKEFGLELLLTAPQVLYQKEKDGSILEPYIKLIVYTPVDFVGSVMRVCQKKKGKLIDLVYHESFSVVSFDIPYTMFIRGLVSELKSASSGFASVDYEVTGFKKADLAKLEILINSSPIDVLSELVYKDEAMAQALEKTKKLKETLSRQQFRQIIQGVVNGTIVAREEIPPFRKDVLAKMSGGDRTRKDKLLDKQKKGKRKMLNVGKINLPQEAFFSLMST